VPVVADAAVHSLRVDTAEPHLVAADSSRSCVSANQLLSILMLLQVLLLLVGVRLGVVHVVDTAVI